MSDEELYQKGYNDFWNAIYDPPQCPNEAYFYQMGYNTAEDDIATGNY